MSAAKKRAGGSPRPGHFDERGQARMVDVSAKAPTSRTAVAEAVVLLPPELLREVLEEGGAGKGDVLAVARLAGIAAAKRAGELIALAHPVALHHVAIEFEPEAGGRLRIEATARARDRTGVEMEAMTAAAVCALNVYDMLKGRARGIEIASVRLLLKRGGRSGLWRRR